MTDARHRTLVSVRSNFASPIKLAASGLFSDILKRSLEFACVEFTCAGIVKHHLAWRKETSSDSWRQATAEIQMVDSDEPFLSPGHLYE